MYKLRNKIASFSRHTPYIRGKFRLGKIISHLLSNYNNDQECITIIEMRDKSLMQLDVRSGTEQWPYWTGSYDDEIISKLSGCLKENCVVLDVGANIGLYSVALGNRLKALNGKIYAFEPVKNNFDRLIKNIALNKLEAVVLAHEIALGDQEGFIEMAMASDNNSLTGNAVMVKGGISRDFFKININNKAHLKKLDTFGKEQKIETCHLIKIDVEGAEVMFLRGAISFIGQHRPIIYGEFNNYFLPQFGSSFLDVVNLLQPLKYRFFKQISNAGFIEVFDPKADSENMLLTPVEISDSVLTKLGVLGV
ncbi:MAG: FkbM family methyltransferase [Nostocales cyanobacterium LacPavin_0920_SED1_MAG_38_18]|nr:FkbM family methyltransferase [Nostocales cyanobacterium LacPavin_0920_SED1_MAG_38_18]